MDGKQDAQNLIQALAPSGPDVPDHVIHFLREICAHNDRCAGSSARIGRSTVIEHMREQYDFAIGKERLDKICQTHLGRRGWANA